LEKNNIIGRDYSSVSQHRGYDSRAENPRLDHNEYRSKHVRDSGPSPNRFHTNRAHGAIYRQSMPFVQGNEEGLFFVAFSRFIDEFERALDRMCGVFQPDGSTDSLFEITRAVTSGYYYVPSVTELSTLPLLPPTDIKLPAEVDQKTEVFVPKLKIVAEYCTNCGYKTIFLEKKRVIESMVPVEWIINPKMPRLASFELYLEDGTVIWSKLALPDGMNNYPHCWPTNRLIIKKMREILNQPDLQSPYDKDDPTEWGVSYWE